MGCEVPPQLALIGGGGEAQLFDQGQNQFGYGGLNGRVGGEIRGAFGPDLAEQALYVGGLIVKDLNFPGHCVLLRLGLLVAHGEDQSDHLFTHLVGVASGEQNGPVRSRKRKRPHNRGRRFRP